MDNLVPEHLRHVFTRIEAEYDRPVAKVLAITGEDDLLGANPVLARTLRRALLLSVNGIAAGLQIHGVRTHGPP